MKTLLLLLLLGPVATREPSLPGFTLGESSMEEVLHRWGSADVAYLAGEDSEGGAKPSDPIVLMFEHPVTLESSHEAEIRVWFSPDEHLLDSISVDFADPVDPAEIKSVYGTAFRVVRHRLIPNDGDTEAELSLCDDPAGTIVTWLQPSRGLQVYLDEETGQVRTLRFSASILSGQESYPPCDPK
jgi:hypothetical protein